MEWLTREQIDQVLERLSADDLIEASDQGNDTKKATEAFNAAAKRMDIGGERATVHVRAQDFRYLAKRMSEVVNIDSPLSEETSDLLGSVDPGE